MWVGSAKPVAIAVSFKTSKIEIGPDDNNTIKGEEWR
jgi:hypothetical protein